MKAGKLTSNVFGKDYVVYMEIEKLRGYIDLLINNQVWFDVEFIELSEIEFLELHSKGLHYV